MKTRKGSLWLAVAAAMLLPSKAKARGRADTSVHRDDSVQKQSRRRTERGPQTLRPVASPDGRHVAEVIGGAVYVDGKRVRTADGRGTLGGSRRLPELRQEFVADDDLGIVIRRVRIAAATLDFEPQRARPAEYAEAIAHALERLLLLEKVTQEIVFSIGRIGVVDRDAILTRGLRLCGGRAERKNDEKRCQTCEGPVHAR